MSPKNAPPRPYGCLDRDDHARVLGRVPIQALMWTVSIEMALVLTQHGTDVFLVVAHNYVDALSPDAGNEAFRRPSTPFLR